MDPSGIKTNLICDTLKEASVQYLASSDWHKYLMGGLTDDDLELLQEDEGEQDRDEEDEDDENNEEGEEEEEEAVEGGEEAKQESGKQKAQQ